MTIIAHSQRERMLGRGGEGGRPSGRALAHADVSTGVAEILATHRLPLISSSSSSSSSSPFQSSREVLGGGVVVDIVFGVK